MRLTGFALMLVALDSLTTAALISPCATHHGFVGDPESTFELQMTSNLSPGQALVLYARGIGPNAAVRTTVGDKQSLPDQPLVLTVLPALPLMIQIQRAALSWDPAPFTFISYIANSDVCRISLGLSTTVVPLPLIGGKPATAFFQIVPQPPNLYFTVSLSSPAGVVASLATERTTSVDDGTTIPLNKPVFGMFSTVSSPAYITAHAADVEVDDVRFVVTQSATPPLGYVPPATRPTSWKEAAKEKAGETESFFGWLMPRLFLCFVVYMLARSLINYRNGITSFPECVPHHQELGQAVTFVSSSIEKIRGNVPPPPSQMSATATRRGYEPVGGYQP